MHLKFSTHQTIIWTPRVISVLYALFLGLFALDVFEGGRGLTDQLPALAIHLIPSALILLVLAISWNREWLGGVIFVVLGISYIALVYGKFDWSVFVIIAGPLILTGILFLIGWYIRSAHSR